MSDRMPTLQLDPASAVDFLRRTADHLEAGTVTLTKIETNTYDGLRRGSLRLEWEAPRVVPPPPPPRKVERGL